MRIDESAFLRALSYNPETGWFTWNISRPGRWGIKPGTRAGSSSLSKCGKRYRRLFYKGQHILEHQLVFLLMEGEVPTDEIDHDNGDGEDNRWLNLNRSSREKNALNLRKRSDNTSKVTGVSWSEERKRWVAFIHVNKKMVNLGRFINFEDAVKVRREAEIKYGYHKNHGDDRPL